MTVCHISNNINFLGVLALQSSESVLVAEASHFVCGPFKVVAYTGRIWIRHLVLSSFAFSPFVVQKSKIKSIRVVESRQVVPLQHKNRNLFSVVSCIRWRSLIKTWPAWLPSHTLLLPVGKQTFNVCVCRKWKAFQMCDLNETSQKLQDTYIEGLLSQESKVWHGSHVLMSGPRRHNVADRLQVFESS